MSVLGKEVDGAAAQAQKTLADVDADVQKLDIQAFNQAIADFAALIGRLNKILDRLTGGS